MKVPHVQLGQEIATNYSRSVVTGNFAAASRMTSFTATQRIQLHLLESFGPDLQGCADRDKLLLVSRFLRLIFALRIVVM